MVQESWTVRTWNPFGRKWTNDLLVKQQSRFAMIEVCHWFEWEHSAEDADLIIIGRIKEPRRGRVDLRDVWLKRGSQGGERSKGAQVQGPCGTETKERLEGHQTKSKKQEEARFYPICHE